MESVLEGIDLRQRMFASEGVEVYRATSGRGADVAVIKVASDAPSAAKDALRQVVRYSSLGGMQVERADENAALASPCPALTLANLGSLGLRLTERLALFLEVANLVDEFHREDISIGPLDPNYILLDAETRPFLLGPGMSPANSAYAAPETTTTGVSDSASDIFSLGRLLQFVLTMNTPADVEGDPARLADLVTYPAGLSRIVRRAVRRAPYARYPSVAEFIDDLSRYGRYDEVGLVHPEVQELNFSGVSYRPPASGNKTRSGSEPAAATLAPSAVPPEPSSGGRATGLRPIVWTLLAFGACAAVAGAAIMFG